MAYRFKLKESLSRGVRRVGSEQFELAERHLRDAADPVSSIHETRKCVKRLRALLRLVRAGIGEKPYQHENRELQQIGRLLSPARDREVMRETLDKLETRLSGNRRIIADRLRDHLDQTLRQETDEIHGKVLSSLGRAKRRFAQIKVQNGGFDVLEAGLHATYRKGRRALAQAQMEPDDEAFHDLRKSVQQHWRQMLLVSRAWPEMCRARASAARDIAQILGEEHDHAVLAAFADTHRNNGLAAEEIDIIHQDCRARQLELRNLALPMARRLFAERPRHFAHQMAASWEVARELNALEPDNDVEAPSPPAAPARVRRAAKADE
jgi:CHAD domain-containing protein